MLAASRRTVEPLAEERAKIKRREKLNTKRALATFEQARLESVELPARRRDYARRALVLPCGGRMHREPLRDPALPRRLRRGREEQSGTASGSKFELELHPFILAERADIGCPTNEKTSLRSGSRSGRIRVASQACCRHRGAETWAPTGQRRARLCHGR